MLSLSDGAQYLLERGFCFQVVILFLCSGSIGNSFLFVLVYSAAGLLLVVYIALTETETRVSGAMCFANTCTRLSSIIPNAWHDGFENTTCKNNKGK